MENFFAKRSTKEFNLEIRDDVALIGFVGRFAKQKGIELIAECIEDF